MLSTVDLQRHFWRLFAILILFTIGLTCGGFQGPVGGYNTFTDTSTVNPLSNLLNTKWSEPYFDIMMPKNITALVGKSAYLSCRVKNLGNKTVAWIRHRDLHILTVATYTYTTDQRFQTTHHKDTDEWTLHIKWAQKRDAGMYECQISTQPIKSYSVQLNVVDHHEYERNNWHSPANRLYNDGFNTYNDLSQQYQQDNNPYPYRNYQNNINDGGNQGGHFINNNNNNYGRIQSTRFQVPTASILGGPDLYVDKGSTINLTCAIRFSPEAPAYIFWYHQDEVISYDSSRGGISIINEKGEVTTSYLLIQDADLADSGKYSCSPSNADVASIRVHVLNGERPEAMQTGGANILSYRTANIFTIFVTIIYFVIYNHLSMYFVRLLLLSRDDITCDSGVFTTDADVVVTAVATAAAAAVDDVNMNALSIKNYSYKISNIEEYNHLNRQQLLAIFKNNINNITIHDQHDYLGMKINIKNHINHQR